MGNKLIDNSNYGFVEGATAAEYADLAQRMTAAEGDIADLKPRMLAAEGNITDLQTRMLAAEGAIANVPALIQAALARTTLYSNDTGTTADFNLSEAYTHFTTLIFVMSIYDIDDQTSEKTLNEKQVAFVSVPDIQYGTASSGYSIHTAYNVANNYGHVWGWIVRFTNNGTTVEKVSQSCSSNREVRINKVYGLGRVSS